MKIYAFTRKLRSPLFDKTKPIELLQFIDQMEDLFKGNEKAHTTNFCSKKAHTLQTFVVA